MKRLMIMGAALLTGGAVSCAQESATFQLRCKPLASAVGQPLMLTYQLPREYAIYHHSRIIHEGQEIASQMDDLNGDGKADELAFTVPSQTKDFTFQVTLSNEHKPATACTPRTRAYIKLHDSKGKHPEVNSITFPGDANILDMYNSIYGHGAVFENEYGGYRIYMDHRQSIDLYGKNTHQLELDSTGFYTTQEQMAKGYGCDILWAGQSVGAGSFRGVRGGTPCYIDTVDWRRQTIIADGPVRSIVEVKDRNWYYQQHNIDVTARYILWAGQRHVKVEIEVEGAPQGMRFCTGVQKLEQHNEGFLTARLSGSWGMNVPDKAHPELQEWVGLGMHVSDSNVFSTQEDEHNYLTMLQPANDKITYYVLMCAGREKGGFGSAKEWFDYLHHWLQTVNVMETHALKKVEK